MPLSLKEAEYLEDKLRKLPEFEVYANLKLNCQHYCLIILQLYTFFLKQTSIHLKI